MPGLLMPWPGSFAAARDVAGILGTDLNPHGASAGCGHGAAGRYRGAGNSDSLSRDQVSISGSAPQAVRQHVREADLSAGFACRVQKDAGRGSGARREPRVARF